MAAARPGKKQVISSKVGRYGMVWSRTCLDLLIAARVGPNGAVSRVTVRLMNAWT